MMSRKIFLRKLQSTDKKYFAKWWRDKILLKFTSGILEPISSQEVEKYFLAMLQNKKDHHFMIILEKKVIGHIVLAKRKNGWYETQIIIGKKNFRSRGYGTEAIKLLIKRAQKFGTPKIYLEVRPNNSRAIRSYEKCGFQKMGIKKYPKNKNLPATLKMLLEVTKH